MSVISEEAVKAAQRRMALFSITEFPTKTCALPSPPPSLTYLGRV